LADGRIVVAGASISTSSSFAVARFNTDGSPDLTFDNTPASDVKDDGIITTGFGLGSNDVARAVAIQADGKIVAAGVTCGSNLEACSFAVARYVSLGGSAGPPTNARMAALPQFASSLTFPIRWSARMGSNLIKNYDVRYRSSVVGHATLVGYQAVLNGYTSTAADWTRYVAGATYCFSVRARDTAGAVSAWSPDVCTATPVDDRSLARTGAWSLKSYTTAYQGTLIGSKVKGATASFTGYFHALEVVVLTCPGCGALDVFVGNNRVRRISLASSNAQLVSVPIASYRDALSRTVTLRVASATGAKVFVDAIGMSLV
jgi:hypothetical protein